MSVRLAAVLICSAATMVFGQTTQGLVSGRLLDSANGRPIAGAHVACAQESTGIQSNAISNGEGYYALPLLPPGLYSIRVTNDTYQSQEAQEVELPVAGRLDLHFLLRPLTDVWEAGLYRSVFLPGSQSVVTFYGPDVDSSHSGNFEALRGQQSALESTISEVIHPLAVERLPLAGRNVYSLLFTLPAVTSDGGVSRGLGLSVNGMRPSSSNFLLDGVENNNYLVTGPLTPIASEAIQEYRVSTSSYSAQYGRTSGFIANAVTRAGTAEWHGLGYFYFRNEVFDANTFQRNITGLARPLDRGVRPGFQLGGPILRNRLYVSAAFERFQGRQRQDPTTFWLPTPALVAALPSTSVAAKLLTKYPTPLTTAGSAPCTVTAPAGCYSSTLIESPISVNQSVGLLRLDYVSPSGAHHVTGRVAVTGLNRPDFMWSPYKDFTKSYDQTDVSNMVSHQWSLNPRITNEFRAAYNVDNVSWGNTGNQVPTVQVNIRVPQGTVPLEMPGSSPIYPYGNDSRSTELLDNVVWLRGRHVITVGAGLLWRNLDGEYAPQGNGVYTFGNFTRFFNGTPDALRVSIGRDNLAVPHLANYDNSYSNRRYFLFAQESFRVTSRLLLNYGLRYESFGAPRTTGNTRNAKVVPGSGSNIQEALKTATLDFSGGPDGLLYQPDRGNVAVRFGFSYNPRSSATLIRGAYGIFYDRPFDNLWQTARTNNLDLAQMVFRGAAVDYSQPIEQVFPGYSSTYATNLTSVPNLTVFQGNLRNGYAQHMFIGIQHQFSSSLMVDVNGMSSLGRRLLTNDTLGFGTAVDRSSIGIPAGQLFTYRANQGLSDYYALAIQARYRRGRGLLQAAYTWSHAIDNQSDPLGLDLSNFGYSSPSLLPAVPKQLTAGFLQPMDSRGDRGNADFDERHNLVVQSGFDLPSLNRGMVLRNLSRDWGVAGVAAVRSGFPYSVYTFGGVKGFTRASIVDPAMTRADGPAAVGGKYLLNPAGFGGPDGPGYISGRNALTGPGLVNFDLNVTRSFAVPRLPESSRLTFRADLFNVLNHANLNNPYPVLVSGFGLATYGRNGVTTGFPTPVPLAETPRQIELSLRLRF